MLGSVVDRPPVHFRHPDGLLPLPMPSGDGSIELLRPYVNLTAAAFRLLVGWMAAALLPEGPRFPALHRKPTGRGLTNEQTDRCYWVAIKVALRGISATG